MEAPAGILCALVTPFNADGTPDLRALAELVEFQVQGGAAGLFVLGTPARASCSTPPSGASWRIS